MSAGNRKFLLREQKSPQHFDHMFDREAGETIPLDEYSQPSVDEARLSQNFEENLTGYTGIHLVAEKPLVSLKFPETSNDAYQLGIYEFAEGIVTDRSQMIEPLSNLFEALQDVGKEYSQMLSKMTLFDRADRPTFQDYCQIRAEVLLTSIPYMIRKSFAEQGLQNRDKDGFGLSIDSNGHLDIVIFDFERVIRLEEGGPFMGIVRNDEKYIAALRKLKIKYSLYNSPMDLMKVQCQFIPSIHQLQGDELGDISMFACDMSDYFMELKMLGVFGQMGGLGGRTMAPKTRAKLASVIHALDSLKMI